MKELIEQLLLIGFKPVGTGYQKRVDIAFHDDNEYLNISVVEYTSTGGDVLWVQFRINGVYDSDLAMTDHYITSVEQFDSALSTFLIEYAREVERNRIRKILGL